MSSNARRRDGTCQTRRCILQIQPVVRKIVELRFDSLIQAFLFFIESLGLIVFAPSNAVSCSRGRYWFSTCAVPARQQPPQFACKYQPILAPTQCTIENTEFLLITRLRSDHLITSFPPLLVCRSHFRFFLTWTSDKNGHHRAPSLRRSAAHCGSSTATQSQQ